jgi:hypothetical protein
MSVHFARWRARPSGSLRFVQWLRGPYWQDICVLFGIGLAYLIVLRFGLLLVASQLGIRFGFVVGSVMVALVARIGLMLYRKTPESVRGLLDFPDTGIQYPVRVVLNVFALGVGSDYGVVTFADDLLHFEGVEVSFDLPSCLAADHEPRRGQPKRFHLHFSQGPFVVSWRHEKTWGQIEFRAYERVRGVDRNYRDAFQEALMIWSNRPGRPHEVLSLPPRVSRRRQGR